MGISEFARFLTIGKCAIAENGIDNPVWRFTTLDTLTAPVDSAKAVPTYWGFTTTVVSCQGTVVTTGAVTGVSVVEWPVSVVVDNSARMERARMDFNYDRRFSPAFAICTVWGSVSHLGMACSDWLVHRPVVDDAGGPLASADTLGGARCRFTSTRLASQLEGMIRLPERFDGFLFRSQFPMNYFMSVGQQPELVLTTRHPAATHP